MLRRLLLFAAGLAAVVAFAALARPDGSSSARISIGASDDAGGEATADGREGTADGREGTADGREGTADGGGFRRPPPGAEVLLRPIDPSTLADVPANLLPLGASDWPFPSADGALLALPGVVGTGVGEVEVVDARTFQPLASVDLEGAPITGFLGFTAEADALVVQRGNSSRGQTLTRYPLDPSEGATTVELPEQLDVNAYQPALLDHGRVALLGIEGGGGGGELGTWTLRVLVADLLAERVVVDLPLPGVRVDQSSEVVRDGSIFAPGVAWDLAGERLYLAHGDAQRVTVVDLASGSVAAEGEINSRFPGPEGLADSGTRLKSAQLSPDGSRLYITGRDFLGDGPGEPLGLSVVDTDTLTEAAYVSGVSDWLVLSPDGRWLAWTAEGTSENDPARAAPFTRVGLLDTQTLEQVALLGNGYRSYFVLGFSGDSAHLYLRSDDGEGGSVLRVHALPSLEQTGERRLPTDAWFEPSGAYLRQPG